MSKIEEWILHAEMSASGVRYTVVEGWVPIAHARIPVVEKKDYDALLSQAEAMAKDLEIYSRSFLTQGEGTYLSEAFKSWQKFKEKL